LRLYRLLVMPKAPSESDRRHADDDCNGEKAAHRKAPHLHALLKIISRFAAEACDFSDTTPTKRNGPRRLVLGPLRMCATWGSIVVVIAFVIAVSIVVTVSIAVAVSITALSRSRS
jgi:hypothetical protein